MTLVLASTSASRGAMLANAGVAFEAMAPLVDEAAIRDSLQGEASARDLADALAEAKAVKVAIWQPGRLVLGGDSVVELDDGRLLDKPQDSCEATEHLVAMSGRVHSIWSAAVVAEDGRAVWRFVDRARMTMRPLSAGFIESYVAQHWPHIRHCVGCYRVEAEGVQLFTRIEGSHFTVLGLPLLPVLDYLRVRGEIAT